MLEGASFILLVGVAMPLKYLAGLPEAVRWLGMAHGVLFIIYCFAILLALLGRKISFGKSVLAFFAAFFPFGPFLIDRSLAEDEAAESACD